MKLIDRIWSLKLNTKFTCVIILFAVAPIAILAGVLFYNMEQSTIHENMNYMEYNMKRSQDQIQTNIDSINMSTQFFLSDTEMIDVLKTAAQGGTLNAEQLVEFHNTDVAALERLVNNNPLLYCVRIFSSTDQVQEMMPVLYTQSRMNKLDWSQKKEYVGWNYNYEDTIFSSHITKQNEKILSLVTPVSDYESGTIGYVEAAMTMETMFPGLYENIDNEWSCFVTDDGAQYFGDNERADSKKSISTVMNQIGDNDQNGTVYCTIDKHKIVFSYIYIKELGGRLVSIHDITTDVNHVYNLRNGFIIVMLLILLLLTVIINFIVKHMLKQFYSILGTVRAVQKGNLEVRIERKSTDEMGELATQLNKMLDRIQKLMNDNINREILAKNSQIRALQNQINAHFIYNVLESIKMMAEIDEKYEISDAITALGKLLRYSMRWTSGNVKVSEELEYIRNYMILINLRFDYEIFLSINVPDILLEQEIPKMSLQPIVENSILHGIEEMAEDTSIYIKGIPEQDSFRIEISDSGKGMTEEELDALRMRIAGKIETTGGKGNGIGLKNVQDRIAMAFGKRYGLELTAKEGCFTKVSVRIPYKEK